ncbi:FAA hydrolase family protein [Xylophilus rhododendri]|uniref:FAA hydrolase family protein n=1 Tax=Xylophilus rhododendri TaxID=2697032 RepID=A0A857J128_9BURK|nr:fumarylacetoacetate hydrolase family protein [Xylophilus rhododendri]QHI96668.1 FAA hydrolase family protein [Xylophilus rhododendri]
MSTTTTTYAIDPQKINSLPIAGSQTRFPVARIFCVGQNYAEHSREMGHNPDVEPPFFFQKPATAIVADGGKFPYPSISTNVHHEVEFVVAIGKGGKNIEEAEALTHVWGYAVGLDMTRRDLQGIAKKTGRPWELGKAFDNAAPCGAIYPVAQAGHPSSGSITLSVNGETRQNGDLSDMIWKVPGTIAYLSTLFELRAGDLIFTGTPSGVGAVQRGDHLIGAIAGLGEVQTEVV